MKSFHFSNVSNINEFILKLKLLIDWQKTVFKIQWSFSSKDAKFPLNQLVKHYYLIILITVMYDGKLSIFGFLSVSDKTGIWNKSPQVLGNGNGPFPVFSDIYKQNDKIDYLKKNDLQINQIMDFFSCSPSLFTDSLRHPFIHSFTF